MSQTGLSLKGKFSNEYVSQIEKNKPIVIEEFISTFCKALNCTRNEFFGIKEGVVRQSLTRLKVPRSHKPMKRRFGTTP